MILNAILLLAQVAATWALVGVIWFVQLAHYPLFARVSRQGSAAYHCENQRRTTWVVGPLMLIEAGTALALFGSRPTAVPLGAVWFGLILLVAVWLSTAFLQVPAHGKLAEGFDAAAVRRLVAGNWLRTLLWTSRGALVGWMMLRALHGSSAGDL